LQPQRNFGLHVDQFFLNELIRGEGPAELLAIKHVLPRRVPTTFSGAERAPGNSIARGVEASERALQTLDAREQVFLRDKQVLHENLPRGGRAQANFAVKHRRRKSLPSFLENETPDNLVIGFGPNHEYIGNRAVGDPSLGAREPIAAGGLARARDHAAGIGAVIGLGQPKAADGLTSSHRRKIFLLLLLGAELENRQHDQ
jgi:hypothetical protein